VKEPLKYYQDIEKQLKANVDYDSIPKPTAAEKGNSKTVSTNLTALSQKQLDSFDQPGCGINGHPGKTVLPFFNE
jgi:hypothetical protein